MKPDENIPLMTWRARPDMSCEYVSRAWLDFTGYTPEQALGDGWTRALHPEDLARWLDTCVRAFDERKPFEIEYRLRRRDGEYRWVLERAAPLYAGDGLFLGYAGACVDIDAHKRMRARPGARARARAPRAHRHRGGEPPAPRPHGLGAGGAAGAGRGDRRLGRPPAGPDHRAPRAHPVPHHRQPARARVARRRGGARAASLRRARAGGGRRRRRARELAEHALGRRRRSALAPSAEEALETARLLAARRAAVRPGRAGASLIRALRALPAERGGCLRAAALTRGRQPGRGLRRAARQAGRAGGATRDGGAAARARNLHASGVQYSTTETLQ